MKRAAFTGNPKFVKNAVILRAGRSIRRFWRWD